MLLIYALTINSHNIIHDFSSVTYRSTCNKKKVKYKTKLTENKIHEKVRPGGEYLIN